MAETDFQHHLHFGVIPTDGFAENPGIEAIRYAGDFLTDTNVEVDLDLDVEDVEGWLSGSWACWGPADQATDGDNTLHILVHSHRADAEHLQALYQAIDSRIVDGRMLDYAVVTTEVHSEMTHLATFAGNDTFVAVVPALGVDSCANQRTHGAR